MTGKEVLFKTLRHEETERPAWVPMAGVHAGFLKGYTADEVYQDADKLVESLLEVEKMYAPDGLILLFDLQLESNGKRTARPASARIPWNRLLKFPISRSLEIPDESLWYWMSRGASKRPWATEPLCTGSSAVRIRWLPT